MLFSGSTVKLGSNAIYGYLTHPDRNTVDLSLAWDNGSKTGANILADVVAMLAAARADLMFGPFVLYIPGAYETVLDKDFGTGGDTRTIRERLLALSGLSAIKVADRMPANNVVLVQLSRETVDMAVAQGISVLQWDEKAGLYELLQGARVLGASRQVGHRGHCGVVHLRVAA